MKRVYISTAYVEYDHKIWGLITCSAGLYIYMYKIYRIKSNGNESLQAFDTSFSKSLQKLQVKDWEKFNGQI